MQLRQSVSLNYIYVILTNTNLYSRIVNPIYATYKNVTLFKKMSPLFQESVTLSSRNCHPSSIKCGI